jgi:hypothetical protein
MTQRCIISVTPGYRVIVFIGRFLKLGRVLLRLCSLFLLLLLQWLILFIQRVASTLGF